MPRRETIIALRARHEAFRVATDVQHPHLDVRPPIPPPVPKPVLPAMQRRPHYYEPSANWQDFDELPAPPRMKLFGIDVSDIVAVIIAMAAAAGVVLLAAYG